MISVVAAAALLHTRWWKTARQQLIGRVISGRDGVS
jgi:hypothetical protein